MNFPRHRGKYRAVVDSGCSGMESVGKDVAGRKNQVGNIDWEEHGDLTFRKEKKRSTIKVVFDGEVRIREIPQTKSGWCRGRGGEKSSIELPSKKPRVWRSISQILNSEQVSLVQCGNKMVTDSEDKSKQVVVFTGDVRVDLARPIRCVAPDGIECTEKLALKGIYADEGEKLRDNTEVIEVKNGEMTNDVGKNEGGNGGVGSSEEIGRRRMRNLPQSLLQKAWNSNENGEGSKTDESLKYLLNVLKMLATEMHCDADDGEIDIFETAKSRGMTFPRSRFLLDSNKDD